MKKQSVIRFLEKIGFHVNEADLFKDGEWTKANADDEKEIDMPKKRDIAQFVTAMGFNVTVPEGEEDMVIDLSALDGLKVEANVQTPPALPESLVSLNEWLTANGGVETLSAISQAVADAREEAKRNADAEAAKRKLLVEGLAANTALGMSSDELEKLPTKTLESLSEIQARQNKRVNYTLLAGSEKKSEIVKNEADGSRRTSRPSVLFAQKATQ